MRRAGRSSHGGVGGKIGQLRGEARRDLGLTAACLLAALGSEEQETDAEIIRAHTGAIWLAETLHGVRDELRAIREMMHKALSKRK